MAPPISDSVSMGTRNLSRMFSDEQPDTACRHPRPILGMETAAVPLTRPDIARACRAPLSAVDATWPRVITDLGKRGLLSDLAEVAAAATIAVETAYTFQPIDEYGGPAYFKRYEGRRNLGNIMPGDGNRYHGRGLSMLTGRANYLAASPIVGIDLVAYPEKALDPDVAAKIFGWFFAEKHIFDAAAAGKWHLVRRRWNGGLNGWDDFNACVCGLLEVLGA